MSIHIFLIAQTFSFSTNCFIHYLWITTPNAATAGCFGVNYGLKNVDIEKTIILCGDFSTNPQP